jgi:hypothetical protein
VDRTTLKFLIFDQTLLWLDPFSSKIKTLKKRHQENYLCLYGVRKLSDDLSRKLLFEKYRIYFHLDAPTTRSRAKWQWRKTKCKFSAKPFGKIKQRKLRNTKLIVKVVLFHRQNVGKINKYRKQTNNKIIDNFILFSMNNNSF